MSSLHFSEDKHYSEPEIIPPRRRGGKDLFWPRDIMEERGTQRIYITRISPFGFLPLVLVSALISISVFVFLFGFLLLLIPAAGIILTAFIVANLLRSVSG